MSSSEISYPALLIVREYYTDIHLRAENTVSRSRALAIAYLSDLTRRIWAGAEIVARSPVPYEEDSVFRAAKIFSAADLCRGTYLCSEGSSGR